MEKNISNTLDYILKKYNIVFDETTKMPIQIPNIGRIDIIRWLRELDFRTGVEVGVAQGEYSKLICENNPQIKMCGVDAWKPYEGYTDYIQPNILTTVFEEAHRRLDRYVKFKRYKIIKEFSMDAVGKFEDNSLDFVYIDANHREPNVTQDITEWFKKVKPGGIIAGHDYVRHRKEGYQVIEAVNRYTNNNNIRPWFILGANEKIQGTIRDDYRSWMWVK